MSYTNDDEYVGEDPSCRVTKVLMKCAVIPRCAPRAVDMALHRYQPVFQVNNSGENWKREHTDAENTHGAAASWKAESTTISLQALNSFLAELPINLHIKDGLRKAPEGHNVDVVIGSEQPVELETAASTLPLLGSSIGSIAESVRFAGFVDDNSNTQNDNDQLPKKPLTRAGSVSTIISGNLSNLPNIFRSPSDCDVTVYLQAGAWGSTWRPTAPLAPITFRLTCYKDSYTPSLTFDFDKDDKENNLRVDADAPFPDIPLAFMPSVDVCNLIGGFDREARKMNFTEPTRVYPAFTMTRTKVARAGATTKHTVVRLPTVEISNVFAKFHSVSNRSRGSSDAFSQNECTLAHYNATAFLSRVNGESLRTIYV